MVRLQSSVAPKKVVLFGTLIKNVRAVGFSGKPDFLERVFFHPAMFYATNFEIVLGVCIVKWLMFFVLNLIFQKVTCVTVNCLIGLLFY